jgi:hypothetical protein
MRKTFSDPDHGASALVHGNTVRLRKQLAAATNNLRHLNTGKHALTWIQPGRAAMLAKRLKLVSDQWSKAEDILKSEQSQMDSLRSDS